MKKSSTGTDSKLKRYYQIPPDAFSLSDLSPTTANVSMPDEYKVECVKAKAELRRRKSSASSTDRSEKASTSSASRVTSTDSTHQSADSVACPSDSSVNTSDSPLRPQRKKDRIGSSNATEFSSQLPSAYAISSKVTSLPESESNTQALTGSVARPSSLTVITRSHPVSVVYSTSHPSVFHRTVSSVDRSEPSNDNLPVLSADDINAEIVKQEAVLEKQLEIPSICLGDDVDTSLKESPTSDDVKSSVAAIRSFYEAKKGKLGAKITEPGFRFRSEYTRHDLH